METFKAICTLMGTLTAGALSCVLSPVGQSPPPVAITPVVAVSVKSCTAPCGVFVDLSGTADPATQFPFHERHYATRFGDAGISAGDWSYGARNSVLPCGAGGQDTYCNFMPAASRNVGIGPEVGHVYATPGTYGIEATVTGPAGPVAAAPVSVTVNDPDVIYGGTWQGGVCRFTEPAIGCTACVGASFANCPGGTANSDPKGSGTAFEAVAASYLDARQSNRVLLHAGEIFDTVTTATILCHDCQVGSFDDGAQPIIRYRAAPSGTAVLEVGPRLTNVSIYGVQIDANGGTSQCISLSQGSARLLFYDFTCTGASGFIGGSTPPDNSARLDEITISSSSWHGSGVTTGNGSQCAGEVVYLRGVTRLSMLGLDLEMADSTVQSMTRLQSWRDVEIGHSYYGRPCPQRAMIDIRGDTSPQADGPVTIARHANIHHIVAVGNAQPNGGGPSATAVQPQSDPADDAVEDLVFDTIACWLGTTSSSGCLGVAGASNVTVRNYIANGTNRTSGNTVPGYTLNWSGHPRHPQPRNVWIYNSVFNCGSPITGDGMIRMSAPYVPGTVVVKNSIYYCPLAPAAATVVDSSPSSAPVTAGNSDQAGGGPTADPMWSNASGRFASYSDYVVGRPGYRSAGVSVPVFFDFAGHPVPQMAPTIGALQ